jgi:hypothetical protein
MELALRIEIAGVVKGRQQNECKEKNFGFLSYADAFPF